MQTGIYIHIPFCRSKCFYCDFKSFACEKNDIINQEIDLYIKKLLDEIKTCEELKNSIIKTIFIGGGTPSIIAHKYIYKILEALNLSCKRLNKNIEITIEANPESLDQEKIFAYRSYGINRISIGLQAIQDKLLKKIGRVHDFKTFELAYNIAINKFNNINLDLIFGLPWQNLSDWQETLIYIKKIKPTHLSAYSLILEPKTKFYKIKSELDLPDENIERQMYYLISKILDKDYYQYEISNFVTKKKFECQHNKIYWTLENYLGFGLAAHSFFNNTRWHNTYSLKKYLANNYLANNNNNKYQREEIINLTQKSLIEEFMFLGLRLNQGVNKSKFKKKFGCELNNIYRNQIILLLNQKLISQDQNFIFLTDYGRDLANYVMSKFLLD